MTEEPIKVGIAGLGRSGWGIHADALGEHRSYAVVGVADPLAERREEARERFGCTVHDEPEALLEQPDVDLLVVATPSDTHVNLAIQAMRAGKDVVVEKPMAQSVVQMDEMIAVAEQTGRFLTCFQQRRLEPVVTVTQEALADGRLGELVLIRHVQHRYARRRDWQMLRKHGGGELSNNVCHAIDQVLVFLADGPVEVFADLKHTVGAGDAEDHVKVCLRDGGGVVADLENSACAAFPRSEWLVVGTLGSVRAADGELTVRWVDPDTLPALTVDEGPVPERRYGTGEQIEWQEETIDLRSAGPKQSQLFYDRLAATLRGGEPVLVTPQSVRRQIEIIETARRQTGVL